MRQDQKDSIISGLRRQIEALDDDRSRRPLPGSVSRLIQVLAEMPDDAIVRVSGVDNVGRWIHGAQLTYCKGKGSVYLVVQP